MKIQQIATYPGSVHHPPGVVVLCEDGLLYHSLLMSGDYFWIQLPQIPEKGQNPPLDTGAKAGVDLYL